MEIMIESYAVPSLFGRDNLQYFADTTCSGIIVTERFTYHYKYGAEREEGGEDTPSTHPDDVLESRFYTLIIV